MIQEQCLNKILHTGDGSFITTNGLDDSFFEDYKNEFNFINSHIKQYSAVPDMETFGAKFEQFDFFEVKEPNDYLLSELIKDKLRRYVTKAYNGMRSSLMQNDVDKTVEEIIHTAENISSFTVLKATNILDDTSRFNTYEDKLQNNDKYFIKTGFKELDDLITGWNRKEDLATIVARNGVGKSWVLFKCATAAAQAGYRVGIYSGEMSTDSVGYRIDTLWGHISNGALVHGGASIKNEYRNFLDKLKDVNGQLWVITPKDIGGFAKPSTLKAFVEKYDIDILFVDQYSLMLDDEGSDIERIRLGNISTGLKLLQTTKQIPIICVCQQNREKLDNGKEFDTTQVAGCDMIAQNSSAILFLDKKDDLMRIYLGKLRESSGVGKFLNYKIALNTGDWIYMPGEDDQEGASQQVDSSGNPYTNEDIF